MLDTFLMVPAFFALYCTDFCKKNFRETEDYIYTKFFDLLLAELVAYLASISFNGVRVQVNQHFER